MLDLRRENYWNLLSPKISTDTIRNVMDMKANMGSFGAALKNKDVWVMNIISEEGPNTLKLVYDRGLIGSIHNWYVIFICLFRIPASLVFLHVSLCYASRPYCNHSLKFGT